MITSETVTSLEDASRLEKEWIELWETCAHRTVTTLPWWMLSFWRYWAPDAPLRIVLVRDGGRLALLAPLMASTVRSGPVTERWLQALAGYESGPPDFLHASPEPAYFDAFWQEVEPQPGWDCVAIWQLPERSGTEIALLRSAEARGLRFRRIQEKPGWVIRTDAPWSEFEATLDRKFRENLRRRQRRLQADHGEVGVRRVVTPGELARLKDRLFALSARVAQAKGRNELYPFHEAIIQEAAARGHLVLDLLEVNTAPVAYNLQFVTAGRVASLAIGYDPAYARYGLGHLLQRESLRRHFADPAVHLYDLMGGGTEHKQDWATLTEGYVKLYIYSRGFRGRALRMAHRAGSGLKRKGLPGLSHRLAQALRNATGRLLPPPRLARARITLNGHALEVEVAASFEARVRGLMSRRRLDRDAGMLFVVREQHASVWMKHTSIPLDLAFIARDGSIVAVEPLVPHSVVPVKSPTPVVCWLEVNRGWFRDHGVHVGDRLELPPSLRALSESPGERTFLRDAGPRRL